MKNMKNTKQILILVQCYIMSQLLCYRILENIQDCFAAANFCDFECIWSLCTVHHYCHICKCP